jgi:hypothetical protein
MLLSKQLTRSAAALNIAHRIGSAAFSRPPVPKSIEGRMAYLRTLQPEEMISGDLGKKAVGCLPISTSQFPANPSAANRHQNLCYPAVSMRNEPAFRRF